MILPPDQRPSDVPDFAEGAVIRFKSRRKAEALPPLAEPRQSNEMDGRKRRVLVLVLILNGVGLFLVGWGLVTMLSLL